MSNVLYYQINQDKIFLLGQTFPLKEQIKQAGGKWNQTEKKWWIESSDKALTHIKNLGFVESPLEVSTGSALMPNSDVSLHIDTNAAFKVSEFVFLVESLIREKFSQKYWLTGEISSYKTTNGHIFFELIEKDDSVVNGPTSFKTASVNCILWAGKKNALQEKLAQIPFQDGTQIKVCVSVDFRKEGARVVAILEEIDVAHTTGNLLLQRLAIVKELKKRGLYDRNKRNSFSLLPYRVALVTAASSRACSDFTNELKLANVGFEVSVFDCNMQGEHTSKNVCQAFQKITQASFDCIVITRGGGSRLDLRWFDDLEIAKAIAYSELPVITAIGHFEDVSIADEIAFHSEKTPTAAARFLSQRHIDSFGKLYLKIESLGRRLLSRFEKERTLLDGTLQRVTLAISRRLVSEKKRLEQFERLIKISKNNLLKPMENGYALVYDALGKVLSPNEFLQGEKRPDHIQIRLQAGASRIYVKARVEDVEVVESEQSSNSAS